MNNNLNWIGNRVLDPNSRQTPRTSFPVPNLSDPLLDDPISPPIAAQMPSQMPSQQPPSTQMPSQQMPSQTQMPSGQTQLPPPATVPGDTGLIRQGPPVLNEEGYIPFFLEQNIGKYVRAEFIIGTTQYVDKTGIIREVGVNYFVLEDVASRSLVMCDLYSVKFVTFLPTGLFTPGS